MDKILYGIIILLLIIVVWKWYNNDTKPLKYKHNHHRHHHKNNMHHRHHNKCNNKYIDNYIDKPIDIENDKIDIRNDNDYNDIIEEMSVEQDVKDSHKLYVNSIVKSGMPTGASHYTDNDALGMSFGDGGDYVGLTRRKFCRARSLVNVDNNARTIPSDIPREECNIGMTDLV